MENLNNQEKSPKQLSVVEQQKEIAGEFVMSRIESIRQEKNIGVLEAAKLVYEEVKGENFREEQATAKLLEFLNLQNELGLREEEIKRTYSKLSSLVNNRASNDDKYLVSA